MEANDIAALGYAIATGIFALLTGWLLGRWSENQKSRWLAVASGTTTIWGAIMVAGSLGYVGPESLYVLTEWLRLATWLSAVFTILRELEPVPLGALLTSRYGIALVLVVGLPVGWYLLRTTDTLAGSAIIAGGFVACAVILSLTEQIMRNASVDPRSGLNYFCIAVVGIFAYDLVLFVMQFADATVGSSYWIARGYVNAMFTVPLAVGISRRFRLSFGIRSPRQIAIYLFSLTTIGLCVAFVVLGNFYIQKFGGSWGDVASVLFVVGAIGSAAILLASSSIRSRVRVFLTKTFLQYKYDYRKEWLRFISTLSDSGLDQVPATAIRAVAQIVNSPGGAVWAQEQESGAYLPVGSWRCEIPSMSPVSSDAALVRFMQERQWIIDLEELKQFPARYADLELAPWIRDQDDWWLIVPLELGSRLYGFILLLKPRVVPSLNFEDHDLLRTVGRHVGTHINQAESDRRLAESSQFGTYNRLTAFLMHDLNNLIAQQSLVVKNAERFRGNPEFVDDAIGTIANSVQRMRRLMEQLSGVSKSQPVKRVDLREVLNTVVERTRQREPDPVLELDGGAAWIQADPERLATVIEHLVRNAQDATVSDGSVRVRARPANGKATIEIADTGSGMSPEFVRERLFRPFDSTKGSQSMGIGAYQARDYVRTLGGQMEVRSEVGFGTTFTIRLPLADQGP